LPSLPSLFGFSSGRRAVESVVPRRTLDDVILPPATRRALDQALIHVTHHDLIFRQWGLAERHPTGLALAFNFAGPSGTGKTICAEAIAHTLGRRLLIADYAELESMWMGETPKNVAAVFRRARDERAGVIETRRGVGSFITATPTEARPPREHERRLRAFVTRVLADADAAGFTSDELIAALRAHKGGA